MQSKAKMHPPHRSVGRLGQQEYVICNSLFSLTLTVLDVIPYQHPSHDSQSFRFPNSLPSQYICETTPDDVEKPLGIYLQESGNF
jgi:hypothetical protein